jgi:hypothetical protein
VTLEKRYIITKRWGIVELTNVGNGLYEDKDGTVFAIEDQESTLDPKARCGIAPFVLPVYIRTLEDGCKVHDYMHQSSAYQLYHTMEEANLEMLRLHYITTKGHWSGILKGAFYYITELATPFLNWKGKKK